MLARKHGFIVLIEDFHQLADHAMRWFFVVVLFLDRHANADGIANKNGLDETQAVIAVGKRLGIDRARRHANRDAEDQRAVRDTLLELLRLAPFGIHVMRVKIARLAGVDDNVRLRDRATQSFPHIADSVVFKKLRDEHKYYSREILAWEIASDSA